MPQLIPTTDEIGIREQRDILFLAFRKIPAPEAVDDAPWERIPERQEIIRWLAAQGIDWEPCFHCAPGTLSTPYRGAMYLDVAPDAACPRYQAVLAFLEDASGQCRFADVDVWLVPLEKSRVWYEARQRESD